MTDGVIGTPEIPIKKLLRGIDLRGVISLAGG